MELNINDEIIKIEKFENNAELFINNSIALYGPSKCGKTTCVKHILYMLRDHFPLVIVYSPNHYQKREFTGIVPEPMIHTGISEQFINSVYERQCKLSKKHNDANTMPAVQRLYNAVKTTANDDKIRVIEKAFKHELDKLRETKLRYMKHIIRSNKHIFETNCGELNKQYKKMTMNPKVLIILDDATVKIEELLKAAKKNINITKFYYEGRHQYITHIYCVHNTTVFPTKLRGNIHVNIFCHRSCAVSWFENKNNADTYLRLIARRVIDVIFKIPHRALIYHTTENAFYYLDVLKLQDRLELCSTKIRNYCSPIQKNV
jgi:energy-coupling factor transporter ATP-binding protein EcfA2